MKKKTVQCWGVLLVGGRIGAGGLKVVTSYGKAYMKPDHSDRFEISNWCQVFTCWQKSSDVVSVHDTWKPSEESEQSGGSRKWDLITLKWFAMSCKDHGALPFITGRAPRSKIIDVRYLVRYIFLTSKVNVFLQDTPVSKKGLRSKPVRVSLSSSFTYHLQNFVQNPF